MRKRVILYSKDVYYFTTPKLFSSSRYLFKNENALPLDDDVFQGAQIQNPSYIPNTKPF